MGLPNLDITCGCGRPTRYMTESGWACNKYFRCSSEPRPWGTWTEEQLEELRLALTKIYPDKKDPIICTPTDTREETNSNADLDVAEESQSKNEVVVK